MKKLSFWIFLILLTLSMFTTIQQLSAQETATVSADPTDIQLSSTQIGQTIKVNITISNAQNLWGWGINELTFNQDILNLTEIQEGPFLKTEGETLFISKISTKNVACALQENAGVNGSGVLATLTFTALSAGNTQIILNNVELLNPPMDENNAETPSPSGSIPSEFPQWIVALLIIVVVTVTFVLLFKNKKAKKSSRRRK